MTSLLETAKNLAGKTLEKVGDVVDAVAPKEQQPVEQPAEVGQPEKKTEDQPTEESQLGGKKRKHKRKSRRRTSRKSKKTVKSGKRKRKSRGTKKHKKKSRKH